MQLQFLYELLLVTAWTLIETLAGSADAGGRHGEGWQVGGHDRRQDGAVEARTKA